MAVTLNTTPTAFEIRHCVFWRSFVSVPEAHPHASTVHYPEDEALPFSEILVPTFYKGRYVPDDTTELLIIIVITAII